MLRSLLVAVAIIAPAGAESLAQRVPLPVGESSRAARQDRGRSLYERPMLSPWIGGDLGLAVPLARCQECDERFGDWATMATGAAGVTIRSRLTLAGELSWMNVFYSRQETSARLTMLTARMGTRRGLLGKVGFGKGRLTVGPGQLVDDKPAWLIGGEYCALSRVDACAFLDYSQTGVGSPRNVSVATVHYRMHALRFGLTARLHLLRGRRITLPPRA